MEVEQPQCTTSAFAGVSDDELLRSGRFTARAAAQPGFKVRPRTALSSGSWRFNNNDASPMAVDQIMAQRRRRALRSAPSSRATGAERVGSLERSQSWHSGNLCAAAKDEPHALDYYLDREALYRPLPDYMASPACGLTPQQRAAAMSWLLATARTSNPVISDATVFLAADYFDRYLAHRANAAACRPPGAPLPPLPGLKLLAATCLWVAGKYEEVHPPSAQVLLALVEKDAAAVTALPPGTPSLSAAMVSLEAALLTGLDFQLNPPTCLSFAHALLSQTCASLPAELHAALNRRVSTVLCAGLSSWDAAWQYLPSTVAGAAVVLCHAELGWSAGGSGSGQAQIQALLGPRCGDTLPAAMLVLCGALQAGNPSSSPSLCGSLCSGSGSSSFMAYGGSQQHFVPVLGGFHCHSPVPGASNSQASSCDACYQQLTLSRTMSAPEHNLVAQYADACMSDADCCCSSQQSSGGSVPLPPLSSAAHVMGYGSGSDDSSADLLMLSAHLNGRLAAAAAAPQGAAPAVGGFTLLPPVAAVKPPPTQAQRRWSSLLPRRGSFRSAVNNLDSLREEEMEEAIAAAASAPLSAYVIGSGGSADDSGCWLGSGLVGEDDWSDSILLDGCDGAAAAADADGQWGRH